jgi:glc operon protein GlcG
LAGLSRRAGSKKSVARSCRPLIFSLRRDAFAKVALGPASSCDRSLQCAGRPRNGGAPISLQKAEEAIHAAVAEANKRGWQLNIAVVDSGGNLVTFSRMDGAQLASISIAEHKARASAKFRRPTRFFEDAVQRGIAYIATLDDIVASRGGIPLIEDSKLIGAIGCSGATGSQDEVVCSAGAATINK